jgi:hypothetical protein
MFKVSSIRPDQKYAMGHGPKGLVKCKCSLECQVMIQNPDKWGRRHEFARGHNARVDTERRARQININRENGKAKLDAARQTEGYKEHMSESQKERWATIKEETPDRVQEIMHNMIEAKLNTPMTEEWKQNIGKGKKKYIEANWDKFMEERKRAGETKRGKPRKPETVAKMTIILQSQERRDIVSRTHKGTPKSESMKEKNRAHWKNPDFRNRVKRAQASGCGEHEPSIPELLYFDLFQMNNLPLEYNGYDGFNVGGFVPDFINHEKKVIVECYGYYHTTEKVIARDVERRRAYADAGYKLIEFWAYHIQSERGHEAERMDEQIIVEEIRATLVGN